MKKKKNTQQSRFPYQKMEYQQVVASCSLPLVELGLRKQKQQKALSPKGKPYLALLLSQVHPIESKMGSNWDKQV